MRDRGRNGVRALVMMSLVSLTSPAFADPITLTSGTVEAEIHIGAARVRFEGDDFFLRVGVDGFRASLGLACTPCTPGSTVNLGGAFNFPRGAGSAVVDGVAYPLIFVDGMTGTFSTPSVQVHGSGTISISVPFSYAGTVNGYLIDPWVQGFTQPAFTKMLVGNGTASATFLFNDQNGPIFSATDLRYEFGEPGPVPEPATLLLCGLGAAVLAVRGRRRRLDE